MSRLPDQALMQTVLIADIHKLLPMLHCGYQRQRMSAGPVRRVALPVTQAGEKPLYLLYSSNHQAMTWLPAEISGPAAIQRHHCHMD